MPAAFKTDTRPSHFDDVGGGACGRFVQFPVSVQLGASDEATSLSRATASRLVCETSQERIVDEVLMIGNSFRKGLSRSLTFMSKK